MKPLFLAICVLLSFSVDAADAPAKSSNESSIKAVMAADKARGAALLAADTTALKKLLAEDFRYTHSNGHLETKATHIQTFLDGLRYTKFETSKITGHEITPNVVVLTGTIDQSKGTGGKMTDYHLLFQGVWRKKGNDWQLASLQTAAPPAPAK